MIGSQVQVAVRSPQNILPDDAWAARSKTHVTNNERSEHDHELPILSAGAYLLRRGRIPTYDRAVHLYQLKPSPSISPPGHKSSARSTKISRQTGYSLTRAIYPAVRYVYCVEE